jgi:hypothetical protein
MEVAAPARRRIGGKVALQSAACIADGRGRALSI